MFCAKRNVPLRACSGKWGGQHLTGVAVACRFALLPDRYPWHIANPVNQLSGGCHLRGPDIGP